MDWQAGEWVEYCAWHAGRGDWKPARVVHGKILTKRRGPITTSKIRLRPVIGPAEDPYVFWCQLSAVRRLPLLEQIAMEASGT